MSHTVRLYLSGKLAEEHPARGRAAAVAKAFVIAQRVRAADPMDNRRGILAILGPDGAPELWIPVRHTAAAGAHAEARYARRGWRAARAWLREAFGVAVDEFA